MAPETITIMKSAETQPVIEYKTTLNSRDKNAFQYNIAMITNMARALEVVELELGGFELLPGGPLAEGSCGPAVALYACKTA